MLRRFGFWLLGLKVCEGCGAVVDAVPVETFRENGTVLSTVRHTPDVCFGVRRSDLARHRVAIDVVANKAGKALELAQDIDNDRLVVGKWHQEIDRKLGGLTRLYSDLLKLVGPHRKDPPPVSASVSAPPHTVHYSTDKRRIHSIAFQETTPNQQEFPISRELLDRLGYRAGVALSFLPPPQGVDAGPPVGSVVVELTNPLHKTPNWPQRFCDGNIVQQVGEVSSGGASSSGTAKHATVVNLTPDRPTKGK